MFSQTTPATSRQTWQRHNVAELPGDLRPAPGAAFVSVREIRRDTAGDTGDAVPRCRLTVMHKYA